SCAVKIVIWSFESFCHKARVFTGGRFRGSPAARRNPKHVEDYGVANADPPPRPRDPGLLDCSNCRWSRDHFHKKGRRSRANSLQVSVRLSALDPTQQRTSQQNLVEPPPQQFGLAIRRAPLDAMCSMTGTRRPGSHIPPRRTIELGSYIKPELG